MKCSTLIFFTVRNVLTLNENKTERLKMIRMDLGASYDSTWNLFHMVKDLSWLAALQLQTTIRIRSC